MTKRTNCFRRSRTCKMYPVSRVPNVFSNTTRIRCGTTNSKHRIFRFTNVHVSFEMRVHDQRTAASTSKVYLKLASVCCRQFAVSLHKAINAWTSEIWRESAASHRRVPLTTKSNRQLTYDLPMISRSIQLGTLHHELLRVHAAT